MDLRTGQREVLQRVVDALAKPESELTRTVRDGMSELGVGDDQFNDIVMSLKMSRCLEVTEGSRTEDGGKVVESIDGITTRGLRVLQQTYQAPVEYESCPVPDSDGEVGFFG